MPSSDMWQECQITLQHTRPCYAKSSYRSVDPQTLHGNVHQVDHVPYGPTNSAATTTMFPLRLCGGKPSVVVTRERRYGPSRIRVNDDDDDESLNFLKTEIIRQLVSFIKLREMWAIATDVSVAPRCISQSECIACLRTENTAERIEVLSKVKTLEWGPPVGGSRPVPARRGKQIKCGLR